MCQSRSKYDPIHTKKFHAVLCIDRSTKTEDVNFILKEFFKLPYITSVFVEIQKEQDEFNTGFLQLKNNCRINYKMYDEFNDWCINNFPIIGDKQEVINIKH